MVRKRHESPEECTRIAHDPLDWGGWFIRPTDRKYENIREAPNTPGIYAWYARNGYLMYVGRSVNIATRLRQHREGTCFMATPSLFSFREVPDRLIAGVEAAHILALSPIENRAGETSRTPFHDAMMAAIDAAWRDVLPAQKTWLDAAYTKLMEEIAARL